MQRKVLMVCLGNICRSSTAHGVLRAKIEATSLAGLVVVDSAGTYGGHAGEPADVRASAVALSRGYDLSDIRSRQVRDADFKEFDSILAMDESNYNSLLSSSPDEHRHKISMLLSYAEKFTETEVPDPYYGGAGGFEHVFDLIEDACDGLIKKIIVEIKT